MSFIQSELAFLPGLFANRSKRGSKTRWVDGNLVRFMDGVPAQMGGWTLKAHTGVAIAGAARGIIGWRPNSQNGRFAAIGSDQGAFLYDGDNVSSITPAGFVVGLGGTILGAGYGSDRFGVGTFGTERASTGNLLDASNWTFDMFGETLIGCFSTDGHIYEFTSGTDAALIAIVGAPTARAICMSDERHLFAFGADGVPGRVKWSDRENYRVWEPLETNRAGSYDLQVTSPFQCGKRVRGQILGWTQTEVFAFAPLFNASVYSRDRISTGSGCVGPQACAVVTDNTGETAYWFGRTDFFLYDGFVRTLPCELHDFVFNDVNLLQGAKFEARTNRAFKEVWFWYCSAASAEVDRAVVYNYGNQTWSKALISRLAWLDAGIFDKPLAVDAAGAIYEHESGATADGATMPSYVVSHPITVGVGQQMAELDQFWPDMQEDSTSCKVSFLTRDTPGGATTTIGPYAFNVGDGFVPLAFSTREFQVRIDGNGGKWELGVPLISMQGGSQR
jgi:hypothetical protein